MATPIKDWTEATPQLDVIARAIEKDLVPVLSFPEGAPHTVAREWAAKSADDLVVEPPNTE